MSFTEEAQRIAWGKTERVRVPSGRIFVIRETNGNDDDILSNTSGGPMTNLYNFLSSVIVREVVDGIEIPFNYEDARLLLDNDRVYLLLAIRVANLGPIVKFKFNFGPDPINGGEFTYSEDLSQFLHDYSKPMPQEGEPGYFKYKIPPYPENAYDKFQMTTQSGKTLRMNLANGISGEYFSSITTDKQNDRYRSRNLEILKEDNTWERVENFSVLSSRDMIELRVWEKEIDPSQLAISEIEHPRTKQVVNFSIMNAPDFFYPAEI